MGEMTRILLNTVLMETFDREFPKRFPGIAFSRLINEVYISTRANDEVIFNDKEGKAGYAPLDELLVELSLSGKIGSIGPGDVPFTGYNRKKVFIDSENKVHVCDIDSY